ncbi:hypothetical protein ILUMI_10401 [Ignelater luminosus]|uniref:Uncharacterized protein n=1 Tax=Ignelater luminosus TaxID=2038154 RepID=A0A8K0D400_IGNLU|nr:hypothetical protein ILUMI_10401 [Ignelater luminosus]
MVWREILIILDAILFCAKNNIALRGSNEIIEDPNRSIFSDLIEFASHYNTTLKEHIEKHNKGSVSPFSPTIQSEIIKLKAPSTLFSHMRKREKGLSTEILSKLEVDKLDIQDCRGQGFGNSANMAGKYKEKGFLNKRKRRDKIMEIDETPDEGSNLTPEELFKIQIYGVLDILLSQIDCCYQKMKTICDDFCFLYGSSLQYMSVDDLKKSATDLTIKCSKDLKNYEFTCKIESLKFEITTHTKYRNYISA